MWDTAVTLVLNAECWVDSGRLGSTRTRLDEAARRCQSVVARQWWPFSGGPSAEAISGGRHYF